MKRRSIAVLIVYSLVQLLESNVITPLVQRHQTRVPALLVLITIMIGGAAMGVLGALVALPLMVSLHALALEMVIPWQQQRARRPEGGASSGKAA